MEETDNNWPGMDHYDAVKQLLALASGMLGDDGIPVSANGTDLGTIGVDADKLKSYEERNCAGVDADKLKSYEERNCAESMGLNFDSSLDSQSDKIDAGDAVCPQTVTMGLDSPLAKELIDKWAISTEMLANLNPLYKVSPSAVPQVPLYEISDNTNQFLGIKPENGTIIGTTVTPSLDGNGYIGTTTIANGYVDSSRFGTMPEREAYSQGPRYVDKYNLRELQDRFIKEMYYEGGVEPGTPMEKWNRVFLLEFIHWMLSDAVPE